MNKKKIQELLLLIETDMRQNSIEIRQNLRKPRKKRKALVIVENLETNLDP